jgi:hypothetical protein
LVLKEIDEAIVQYVGCTVNKLRWYGGSEVVVLSSLNKTVAGRLGHEWTAGDGNY